MGKIRYKEFVMDYYNVYDMRTKKCMDKQLNDFIDEKGGNIKIIDTKYMINVTPAGQCFTFVLLQYEDEEEDDLE